MIKLADEDLSRLAGMVISAITPEGVNVAELIYGGYYNAIVVSFPYKRSHECTAGSLDEAVESLIANRTDDIKEAIAEWFEDMWGAEPAGDAGKGDM